MSPANCQQKQLFGNSEQFVLKGNEILLIKERIRSSQIKAAVSVNRELLGLYWSLGEDIARKQMDATHGSSENRHQLGDDLITKLLTIPWRHIEILGKCKEVDKGGFGKESHYFIDQNPRSHILCY